MALILDQAVGSTPSLSRAERAKEMVDTLRKMGVPATLGRLHSGDVSFTGNGPAGSVAVGIELKTVTGFMTDITTGRFVGRQVPEMQKDYVYRYLILEGAIRPAMDGILEVPNNRGGWGPASPRMMYQDLIKFLEDVSIRGGFQLRRTWGKYDTLNVVAGIYKWWQKDWSKHKALKQFNDPATTGSVVLMTPPTLRRLWARDLPGVGWERSEALERRFKTPFALAKASVKDLEEVPGIGPKTAERIWMAIRGLEE